ncbi:hypothetical protein [Amycolatopsis orientalis]|uniref:hypothetical protein n=1 Tax=Amycolatopsis orientalis TaxID=31958 RepID=UPI00056CA03F|nr:hypothetical protein [Amycolatopsis orientalis]
MALPSLAGTADLAARGIDVTNTERVAAFLAAASSEVRSAAGSPITRTDYTADIPAIGQSELTLPAQPIRSVAWVLLDGEPVTDWRLVNGSLWRQRGWGHPHCPRVVTVSANGGLDEVPADVVDLVCSLVGLALANAEDGGYSSRGDLTQLRIDDYSEGYNSSASGRLAGVIELPDATRKRLRARFGGSVAMVRFR